MRLDPPISRSDHGDGRSHRFSTNTFPSWARAQPYRILCHNGEINTLRGNINRMRARQGVMHASLMSDRELEELYPVVDESGSDSGMLDNALQFYSRTSARSLPETLATMVLILPRSSRERRPQN